MAITSVLTQQMVAIAPGRFGSPYAYGNGVGTFQRGGDLYIVCSNPGFGQGSWTGSISGTPPPVLAQIHVLKSKDNGATWVEVDTDNGPEVSLLKSSGFAWGIVSPVAACYQDANTLLIGYFVWDYVHGNASTLRFCTFSMATDSFGAEVSGGPSATQVANQGDFTASMAFRSGDSAIIFEYAGFELVGGTPRPRVFYVIYNAGFGVAAPVDATQTGAVANYNIAGAVTGDGGRTHLFYRVFRTPFAPGDMLLLQKTLTSLDVLVASVQITDQVNSATNQTFPFPQPWSQAVGRLVSAATHLYIAYVKDTDKALYFQTAISANTPAFSEQLIGGTTVLSAGIFEAGNVPPSAGLVATTQDSNNADEASGSTDETTWDAMIPIVVPTDPSSITLANFSGLGINSGSGGFLSSGIVQNSVEIPPG